MPGSQRPLPVLVYQDVLCAWCYLAESRLATLRAEFGNAVSWHFRPFPLRVQDRPATEREMAVGVREVRRAQKEKDGAQLSTDLWTAGDPPRSSVTALKAMEAAKLQGPQALSLLTQSLQRAGLELGLNVTRSDVVLELASRVGLDMNRFTAAYHSPQTHRLVMEEHRLAASRGVRGVPTLVLGGRWMLCGLRETSEYRAHIQECLSRAATSEIRPWSNTLH